MKIKLLNMRYLTVTSLEPLGLALPYAFTVVLFQMDVWKNVGRNVLNPQGSPFINDKSSKSYGIAIWWGIVRSESNFSGKDVNPFN